VVGSGYWCFLADQNAEKDEIVITGEKGEIALSCFAFPEMLKITTDKGDIETKFDNPKHISQNLVQQLINELRGVGTCVSTGESAARTSWVLDQMVRNYYSDQL
jgi:hypothetical protein